MRISCLDCFSYQGDQAFGARAALEALKHFVDGQRLAIHEEHGAVRGDADTKFGHILVVGWVAHVGAFRAIPRAIGETGLRGPRGCHLLLYTAWTYMCVRPVVQTMCQREKGLGEKEKSRLATPPKAGFGSGQPPTDCRTSVLLVIFGCQVILGSVLALHGAPLSGILAAV